MAKPKSNDFNDGLDLVHLKYLPTLCTTGKSCTLICTCLNAKVDNGLSATVDSDQTVDNRPFPMFSKLSLTPYEYVLFFRHCLPR